VAALSAGVAENLPHLHDEADAARTVGLSA
jgi:hypothetical protein